jgi:YggT family protein
MLGDILRFIIEIVFTILGAALLVRAWMHAVRLPPFNPLAQAVFRSTEWLVGPLRKIFPHRGRVEWSCLFATWLTALVYIALMWVITLGLYYSPELPTTLIGGSLITVVKWALNLIVWLTLIQAILSWVNPVAPMMPVLQTLTAPLLDPVRRLLPSSTIDFSPLVVLVLAQIAMMTISRGSFGLLGF